MYPRIKNFGVRLYCALFGGTRRCRSGLSYSVLVLADFTDMTVTSDDVYLLDSPDSPDSPDSLDLPSTPVSSDSPDSPDARNSPVFPDSLESHVPPNLLVSTDPPLSPDSPVMSDSK